MKIRSLALALALSFAVTTVAEAKKKPVYSAKAQKAHNKATVHKYKPSAHKVSAHKVSKLKVKHKA
jgi:hypothetical protein